MEPETYPPEVLADDEPRYLRRQKPVEVRRRKLGRKWWQRYAGRAVLGLALFVVGWLGYGAVHFVLTAPEFALAGADSIAVHGTRFVPAAAVREVFAADAGRSVLRISLEARRQELERIPWVESARVRRVLPNRLEVEITERRPVAFLRLGVEMALMDAEGIVLEPPPEGEFRFPVVTGLTEAMPAAERKQRVLLFLQFLRELDLARPGAAEQVSEVDLSEADDVRVTLAGLPGWGSDGEEDAAVLVYFGDHDFQTKYRLLLENLAQWRATAGRVESVDLRFERQVVVNPTAGPAAQNLAAGRAP